MELLIGTYSEDAMAADKTFTQVGSALTCTVKQNTDVIRPVFIIRSPATAQINYCYADDFGRWYFIENIEVLTGGMTALHCFVDVRSSFKNGIRALDAIIEKQERQTDSNMYLNDGSFVTEVRTTNEVLVFDDGFNDTGEYILISAGGGV